MVRAPGRGRMWTRTMALLCLDGASQYPFHTRRSFLQTYRSQMASCQRWSHQSLHSARMLVPSVFPTTHGATQNFSVDPYSTQPCTQFTPCSSSPSRPSPFPHPFPAQGPLPLSLQMGPRHKKKLPDLVRCSCAQPSNNPVTS